MEININEIAKRAGVSIATVSRALNGSKSVRDETRQKIIRLAKELNYKPNPFARGLSKKQTDTIGVILPELVDEFFTEIIRGIDEEAYRMNRYIMLSSSHSRRNTIETLLEFMSGRRVDGVIIMAPQIGEDVTPIVQKSKRPVVMLNCAANVDHVTCFKIDNYQGAFKITEHLIGHDYSKIGMIKGPEGNFDAEERFDGFKDALLAHNIDLNQAMIVPGEFSMKSGYYGLLRLMNQKEKPEAVFAANDMMAIGAYGAARSSNIQIPKDLAIVGFDDIFPSRLLNPRLTTVHVPIVELGMKAVRYLLKMINKEVDPRMTYLEELSTGIVIGGSCGCENLMNQSII
ncbi:LacI family DNA-binding transcriptional regulator [candidate division KSB1 bacterium]|nr:LacI family DNA-binding transcriptional regulator [candidate division KSB1 bacterium]